MPKIFPAVTYTVTHQYQVDLPEHHPFEKLLDFYIKWNEFHYTVDGMQWYVIEMVENDRWEPNFKRARETQIFAADSEGACDYDTQLFASI